MSEGNQTMEAVEKLKNVNRTAEAVVAKIVEEDLPKLTPCGTWTVRQELNKLMASVIHSTRAIAEGVDDEAMDLGNPPELIGDDPHAALVEANRRCEDAFSADGALEQVDLPVPVPDLRLPATMLMGIRLFDTTVVTWDLAKAIGVDHGIDEATAAEVKELGAQIVPAVSGAPDRQRFQDAIDLPDGSPMVDQLIALTGRDPAWQGS